VELVNSALDREVHQSPQSPLQPVSIRYRISRYHPPPDRFADQFFAVDHWIHNIKLFWIIQIGNKQQLKQSQQQMRSGL